MDRQHADDALRAGDVDELLRIVDGICAAREWEALERLRARCAAASDDGHQLWPVASRAAYLLALDAPAALAGSVVVVGAGKFAPGPLPEVAAQAHTWADLAPHIPTGPQAVVAAHERVLRGEDLSGVTVDGPPVLELPLRLADWEPAYALAQYGPDSADFPPPDDTDGGTSDDVDLAGHGAPNTGSDHGDDVVDALLATVRTWADESSGTIAAIGATGGALDAIASLDTGTVRVTQRTPSAALALLAWAGASGGAHAPRPGAAAGRFSAWWVAGALTGLLDEWPPDPDVLGARLAALEWCTWDRLGASPSGWNLRLAVSAPARGRAWAVHARDAT